MQHIGFSREPDDQQRRTRSNPSGFPGVLSGSSHGSKLNQELVTATKAVAESRRTIGIDPSRLVVLEISSCKNQPREVIERLGAFVVNERLESNATTELLAKLPHGVSTKAQIILQLGTQDLPSLRFSFATDRDLPKEIRPKTSEKSKLAKSYVVFQLPQIDEATVDLLKVAGFEPIGKPNETSREVNQMLVQFPTQEQLDSFLKESESYQEGSLTAGLLPRVMRNDFFDSIEWIGCLTPDRRRGPRLAKEGCPPGRFAVDVDLWHPGNPKDAREVLDSLRQQCRDVGGAVVNDHLLTNSLVLARIHCDSVFLERLLTWDAVAQVDLPPRLPAAYSEILSNPTLSERNIPDGTEPTICVVDSGVLSGHPLLQGWIIDGRDFETGENTEVDRVGHGTQVAGLAVYGSIAKCLESNEWQPRATILNAKVLCRHDSDENVAVFPENQRPENVVKKAIEHFHNTRECRIFNLSLGNTGEVYQGGRQFAWAEVLDQIASERDVVIIVSAGNNSEPPWPDSASTRAQFQEHLRNLLIDDPACRICNPATAAIAITVGAIARSDAARSQSVLFAGSPKNSPSPFSRVGPGYESKDTMGAIKPDFVAFGGNFGVQNLGRPDWQRIDLHLGEPTLRPNFDSRNLTAVNGTSFAAPQISFAAAFALQSASAALSTVASANAARALMGACSERPECGGAWLLDPEEKETEEKLRLVGYGQVNVDRLSAALRNDLCLLAEDTLLEDHWQFYTVTVPPSFIAAKGPRGITASLAFDPPVRLSRRDYLSRTMEIEVLKGVSREQLIAARDKAGVESLKQSHQLTLYPPKTVVARSTLQVRRMAWKQNPSFPLVGNGTEPQMHILVKCQSRFPSGRGKDQRYALAVRFWHSDPNVELYQELQARVRPRAETRLWVERRG